MNRYWLFGYDNYYPLGGMDDLIWRGDDTEELMREWQHTNCDYVGAVDMQTQEHIILTKVLGIPDYRFANTSRCPIPSMKMSE